MGGRNSPQVLRGWLPLLDVEVPTAQARSLEPGGWRLVPCCSARESPTRRRAPQTPEEHGHQERALRCTEGQTSEHATVGAGLHLERQTLKFCPHPPPEQVTMLEGLRH